MRKNETKRERTGQSKKEWDNRKRTTHNEKKERRREKETYKTGNIGK